MAGGLKQIALRYEAADDRVLFLFNTHSRQEYKLWLTRTVILRGMWPAIQKLLAANPDIQRLGDQETKKAMMSFQHHGTVDKSAFGKEFDETPKEYPLGETPVLVTGLRANADGDGKYTFAFQFATGGEASLRFDDKLLHNFVELLIKVVNKAPWDVQIGFDAGFEKPAESEKRLH